jgi:hypothetical protein
MAFRKKPIFPILTLIVLLTFLMSCASGPKNTRLHKSIIQNDNESARKAALSTKNINEYDKYGRTALHLAVLKNNKELTEFLITNGADINNITYYGHTPLSLSMRHDDLDITKILIDAGAEINTENSASSPLIEAIKFNRINIAKKLMVNGADINASDKNYATALYYAASLGLNDLLQELIDRGANLNTKTNEGMSPIHAAAFNENKDIVRTLLAKGAKIYPIEKNEKGRYSTAMLYLYVSEIFESNDQQEEASLAYKKALKYNELTTKHFRDRDGEIKWKGIKQGLTFLAGFVGFASVGVMMIPVPAIPGKTDIAKFNFYSEDTNYLVSGYSSLNKTHPEYFEIKKKELPANAADPSGEDTDTDTNNPYKDFSTIKRQIYRGLSEKCALQAKQCSKKIDHLSNDSKKELASDINNEILSSLKELESIDNKSDEQLVNLYIYRKYRFVGSAAVANFFIDNCYYSDLKCNKYLIKKVKSGTHHIKLAYHIPHVDHIKFYDTKTIKIENGRKNYYVQMSFGKEDTMSVVTKETAEKEMSAMTLTETMQKKIFE